VENIIKELPALDHPSPLEFSIAESDLKTEEENLQTVKTMLDKIEAEIQRRSKKKSNTSHEQTAGGLRGKRKSRRILKGLKNKKFRKTCRKSTRKSR